MKRIIKKSAVIGMAKEPSRGVFWSLMEKSCDFLFYEDAINNITITKEGESN